MSAPGSRTTAFSLTTVPVCQNITHGDSLLVRRGTNGLGVFRGWLVIGLEIGLKIGVNCVFGFGRPGQ